MNPAEITAIIALCAIISPMLTAIINNHYQIKLKRIEIQQAQEYESKNHLKQLQEEVLMNLGACLTNPTPQTLSNYSRCYALAFQVLPQSVHSKLKDLNFEVSELNWRKL